MSIPTLPVVPVRRRTKQAPVRAEEAIVRQPVQGWITRAIRSEAAIRLPGRRIIPYFCHAFFVAAILVLSTP
jgi:hypothetical protein